MRQFTKSVTLVIVFLAALLSMSITAFSQNKKSEQKKLEKKETISVDTGKKEQAQFKAPDTAEAKKVNSDTTANQSLQTDTVAKAQEAKDEILKQLHILLDLNKSNLDSIENLINKKDSNLALRLDTIRDQTNTGFWEGFVTNSVYTWMYDTLTNLFTSNKDASGSFFVRLLTFLAIIARFILLISRLKEYFGAEKRNDKPNKWRLIVSILSWLILVSSFSSYSQNKSEEYLENINDKLKQIEIKANQQINSIANTSNQFDTLLYTIDRKVNSPEQLKEYNEIKLELKTQNEALAKSQREIETSISELKIGQANAESNIIDKVKDYSVSGFWILVLILVIIFGSDIRNLLKKDTKA